MISAIFIITGMMMMIIILIIITNDLERDLLGSP